MRSFTFADLSTADLYVDALYESGRAGNAGDDPFSRLLTVSNQGGFRYKGSLQRLELLVLTSSLGDPDWPDAMDRELGIFTYYGDNKKPGRGLHETPRHGNEILRDLFDNVRDEETRRRIPPILLFRRVGAWRDVSFLGLAVPGTADLHAGEDLVAIWRTSSDRRFQNYRARFTVLDLAVVTRSWLHDIVAGNSFSANAPPVWMEWIRTGHREPLRSRRSLDYRSKTEQLPSDDTGHAIVDAIHRHFFDRAHDFEHCATAIARLMLPDISSMDLTRPSRDGGRDAVGQMRVGRGASAILVDFSLEAKCYHSSNGVGVKEMSRLISRLRHRQFGILVTTSYVDSQTYQEIRSDGHPIVVIAAADIAQLLRSAGYHDAASVVAWLNHEYPRSEGRRGYSASDRS